MIWESTERSGKSPYSNSGTGGLLMLLVCAALMFFGGK
jgi:hypothetical protein